MRGGVAISLSVKTIDIFTGHDILCIKINISDLFPINFNRGSGCLMARIQKPWLLQTCGVCEGYRFLRFREYYRGGTGPEYAKA